MQHYCNVSHYRSQHLLLLGQILAAISLRRWQGGRSASRTTRPSWHVLSWRHDFCQEENSGSCQPHSVLKFSVARTVEFVNQICLFVCPCRFWPFQFYWDAVQRRIYCRQLFPSKRKPWRTPIARRWTNKAVNVLLKFKTFLQMLGRFYCNWYSSIAWKSSAWPSTLNGIATYWSSTTHLVPRFTVWIFFKAIILFNSISMRL